MEAFEFGEDPVRRPASRRVTIAVLSDDVSNGYSRPILTELSHAARERGVALINFVEWLDPASLGAGTRRPATDLAGPDCADAILLLPIGYNLTADDLAGYCQRFSPLPICSIPDIAGNRHSRVSVDNEPGMRAAVTHLVQVHGHRRIGFVRGPERSDEADLRYRVYREVLEGHGITPDPAWVAPGNYVMQGGVDAVRLFLDERRLELDAIVCANDGMALGALEALTARGIRVPDRIALVGFDDVDAARCVDPPLTTVRQPLRELGRTAFELLLWQIEHRANKQLVLPSELVVRESCGCASYRVPQGDSLRAASEEGAETLRQAAPALARAMRGLRVRGAIGTGRAETLCDAFVSEVFQGAGVFLQELRELLNEIAAAQGDVGAFHKVLTILWQHAQRSLAPGSIEWRRADVLLHAARAATSTAAERAQTTQQALYEELSYKLTRTGNALGLAGNLDAVGEVLSSDLPGLGIDACYVCVYEGERENQAMARLVAGFGPSGRCVLPDGGVSFPAGLVVPGGALLGGPTEYIVGPLARSGDSPGYTVFARGPFEGFVYETLMAQVGGAVARLDLLERLLAEGARREAAERRRLEEELLIATRVQTGVLPRGVEVKGLEIAATMLPAAEVGGDYYDVIPTPDGCWLGIGDVAGHGLPTGLVMLMLQSAVASLLRLSHDVAPGELLNAVNEVLYDNVRHRLLQDQHVTLTMLRYRRSGRVIHAGAHEDLLVYRASERRIEWIPSAGAWVAAARNMRQAYVESSFELSPGDVLVLYSDGVTEARDEQKQLFGIERLAEALLARGDRPVEAIRDGLLDAVRAFRHVQEDDVTLLVARHRG